MNCKKVKTCGCLHFNRGLGNYEDDSTSSDDSEAHSKKKKPKPPSESIVRRFLTQINVFNIWKRHNELSMTKLERTMKAALLIQQWYRSYLARMEIRRRYTWTIFQSIEYAGEQDQMKLYNFFNALLTHIPYTSAKSPNSETASKSSSMDTVNMKFLDESDELEEEGMQNFEKKYRGIHLNFPLTKTDLDVLLESHHNKSKHRLHARYVARILKDAAAKLRRLPNISRASTTISKQITVCGDLHGKIDDLLVILHKNGLPSPENPYVFNGDFVDRGKKGLEVLLVLLSCMLVFSDCVFLNRGNHEDHIMNARYGFIREVHQKYKRNAEVLLKLIDNVYRWLPLATIVDSKVLIVHGGISDTTDLKLIDGLDRGKYLSLLRPPILDSLAPGTDVIDKAEWKQVFDILWSDPQHSEGCIPNGLRGAGTYFGPDVSKKFLKDNGLLYLIRSHECKRDGYEIIHDDRVITIFSASNYYEVGSNKGAYVKLMGPDLAQHFVQYVSEVAKVKNLTFRQCMGLVECSAIRELSAQILSSQDVLDKEFHKIDPENTGWVTIGDWCKVMENATSLGLPWRLLRDKLVTLDPETGKVRYGSIFEGHAIVNAKAGSSTVVDTLYRNKSNLEAIFRIIDKDHSGFISLDEFSDACNLIRQHMPNPYTQEQLVDICKLMDMNKDGLVDLNEFLETFRLVDKPPPSEDTDKKESTSTTAKNTE